MDTQEILQNIAQQVSTCQKCALHFSRKKSVPGVGPIDASILLIGEGPGFYENESGLPFVGAAGKFLDELLQKGGLKRSEVFITNVVKCRPPGNRDPLPEELSACSNFLDQQISTLNPRVIITLGRFSMARYLPNAKISSIHGQASWVNGRLIVPMYHPAAALHQPSLKNAVEQDFSRLPEWLQLSQKSQQIAEKPPEKPQAKLPETQQVELFQPGPQENKDHTQPPVPKETPKQLSLF